MADAFATAIATLAACGMSASTIALSRLARQHGGRAFPLSNSNHTSEQSKDASVDSVAYDFSTHVDPVPVSEEDIAADPCVPPDHKRTYMSTIADRTRGGAITIDSDSDSDRNKAGPSAPRTHPNQPACKCVTCGSDLWPQCEACQNAARAQMQVQISHSHPPYWDESLNSMRVHYVNLDAAEDYDEWRAVAQLAAPAQVTRIQRVQNELMWRSYSAQRTLLLEFKYRKGFLSGDVRRSISMAEPRTPELNGTNVPVGIEAPMWHGTKQASPRIITNSAYGWCRSYAAALGSAGTGSYFADDLQYSLAGYAYTSARTNKRKERHVILADVLLGARHQGGNGTIVRAPPMPPDSWWRTHAVPDEMDLPLEFDSVRNVNMSVVYGQGIALAYPRYIVSLAN